MIKLTQLCLQRGTKILLECADWTLDARQRIGLIGRNGCGKSSLFALIRGELAPEQGKIEWLPGTRIAWLAQETEAVVRSALDYVIDGDTTFRQTEAALLTAEENRQAEKIAELHERMRAIDGYSIQARASSILRGLGFSHADQQKSVADFSGGWRMRLNLAKALIAPADILLLDEPTNHLDLEALIWLENFLQKYPGTLLLISHDRDFLDNVVNHIAHIENRKIHFYTGHYSDFEKQRAQILALQQAHYEKQLKQREHMQKFIDRFRAKATKARQAQSRIKALEKMPLITLAQIDSPFSFQFPAPAKLPNPLLRIEHVSVAYDAATPVLKDIHFSLRPDSRLGIIGPNGAGKSTFIKLLAGLLAPTQGQLEKSPHLKIAYFCQHQLDYLRPERSPLQHLLDLTPTAPEQQCRDFLGGFNFRDDMATEPVAPLSGGEKTRLALALMVWQKPNLLLLDEPTNHLDLEMRQALINALQDYQGALLIITHDRHLLRSSADELYLVYQQRISPFEGSIDDYPRWLQAQQKAMDYEAPAQTTQKSSRKDIRVQSAKLREQLKPLTQRLQRVEKQMEDFTSQLQSIATQLQDPGIYEAGNKENLQKLLLRQGELKRHTEKLEEEWLEIQEQLSHYN